MTKKNKVYITLLTLLTIGWIWLIIQSFSLPTKSTFCIVKTVTTYPCPSCGSTRSILEIMHGNFTSAFMWNPLGFISFTIMVTAPIWLLYDFLAKKETLYNAYQKTEKLFTNKWIYIPSILLIVMNWIWNINKGL